MKALEILGPACALLVWITWRSSRAGKLRGAHCGSALVLCARCEERAANRRVVALSDSALDRDVLGGGRG